MFSRFKYKDGKTVTRQLNCDIFFNWHCLGLPSRSKEIARSKYDIT